MSTRFDRIVPKRTKKPAPPPPKSFEDKLRDGDYQCKLPHPPPQDQEWREKRAAHLKEVARLEGEFKKDMFDFYGVTGHPKAQRAFEIAWDYGHAAGLSEVNFYFSDLSELLQ